jgi:hypothetical protein
MFPSKRAGDLPRSPSVKTEKENTAVSRLLGGRARGQKEVWAPASEFPFYPSSFFGWKI